MAAPRSPRQLAFNIDPMEIRYIMTTGVRRAAAFLGMGMRAVDGELPTSVKLSGGFHFQFLEDPLPPALAKDIVGEFRAWLVGACLRELDTFFSLFLDEIGQVVHLAQHHGRPIPRDYKPSNIRKQTNVANKLRAVLQSMGKDTPNHDYLRSLSNARNCLAHSGGLVGRDQAHMDGELSVSWLGMDLIATKDGLEVVMSAGDDAVEVTGPAEISVRFTERERRFAIDDSLVLAPYDLAEIIWFYDYLATETLRQMMEWLDSIGVATVPRPEEAAASA